MDFLKEQDVVGFIVSLGASVVSEKLGGSPTEWKVKEVGDGNLNFIYLVQGTKDSVIVKTAPPFIRCIGESWPLTPSRISFEYLALEAESKVAPEHVPAIYHYDAQRHLIIMQYMHPHIILRKGLIQGIQYSDLADHLSTFLAQTLFKTSGFALKTPEKNKLVAQFSHNYDLCVVTEQVIFTEPFMKAKNNRWNSPYLDDDVTRIQEDGELKIKISILKSKFQQHAEALIHADFHTGSIMVTQTSTVAIDPEFAFYGPMAFDTGLLFANLFLSYFSQDGHGERNHYKEWILQVIQDTWNTFAFKFVELWDKEHTGDVFCPSFYNTKKDLEKVQQHFLLRLLQDTLGFAAAEIIRRIVGVAHVEDLEAIEDPIVRAQCEKKALMFAREIAVNSEGCLSFTDVCHYATQV
mmetsp:Transcript_20477/g.28723  ORF Transcript_20477/g.28723 Transcript_20477/m.28723 type:complete len:408 (+) Transcript_20477:71-1294(+)